LPPLVLIVDDEALIALDLQMQMEAAGYRTKLAFGLDEARYAFRSKRPDAIVLDLNLGGVSSELWAMELLADGIPLIICSGNADQLESEALRAQPRLSKPYQDGMLLTAVRNILSDQTSSSS
jgi:DNA-binding response OmpR family regulator